MGVGSFFTIGHSTRSVDELADLLDEAGATMVVGVRTVPGSRTNPQFNMDVLLGTLAARRIAYRHLAALGGLRSRRKDAGPSPNTFWENASFRNYADYADTGPFREGLAELRALGATNVCAIMCAEAVWWRCHRRIIADYLIAGGTPVFHIMGLGKITPASLTPSARPAGEGRLIYALA
jgi:uncharacterized protein (DUF488 family)